MTHNTTQSQKRRMIIPGVVVGGALALGLASPAVALAQPLETAMASERASTPTFTPDLQTEIEIGEASRPSDFVASADGAHGYVSARELNEIVVVDMADRTVSTRISFPGVGASYVRLSSDGTRAYFVIQNFYYSTGIGVIDLVSGTLLDVFEDVPPNIQELALSRDGASVYAVDLAGPVVRLDADTGEELASFTVKGNNFHGMTLINDDSQLLVSREQTISTLDADTLVETGSAHIPGVGSASSLRVDTSDERVYFADSSGITLGVFNPATGAVTGQVEAGELMHEVQGYDELNRAFGNSPYENALKAADFTTGRAAQSLRTLPNAPFAINKNAVTGELLSANGGWSNAAKGSTVTIVNTPSVTDPLDVTITELGGSVRFETHAAGITRDAGGGINWQWSPDGTTWVNIAGATDEQLDVDVTEKTVQLQYRVRWSDEFWGQNGASAAARILAPAPMITFEGPFTDGTVDEAYPETIITATGQDDLTWSVVDDAELTGLPAGLELDAATGALTGTPSEAGTFTFTVNVTDVFGEDNRSYTLSVLEPEDPTAPTDPEDPVDPTVPTDPIDPTEPTDSSGPGRSDDGTGGGQLSESGGASPLILGLIAAGVVAVGGTALVVSRVRRSQHGG